MLEGRLIFESLLASSLVLGPNSLPPTRPSLCSYSRFPAHTRMPSVDHFLFVTALWPAVVPVTCDHDANCAGVRRFQLFWSALQLATLEYSCREV